MTSPRYKILRALKELSMERNPKGAFIVEWQRAKDIAKRAGVSENTARRYLEHVHRTRGFFKRRFYGRVYGYLYLPEANTDDGWL